MRIVSSRTIVTLYKSRLVLTACVMILLSVTTFHARVRINIDLTKLLATFPAPRTPTSRPYHEFTRTSLQTTGKNIITRCILQSPALTPRTLFRIHLISAT